VPLWIAPEREQVGSARLEGRLPEHASSKAVASEPDSKLGRRGGGDVWSASGLPELWIAPEREHVGSANLEGRPEHASSKAVASEPDSKLGRRGGGDVWSASACRSFGSRRSGNSQIRHSS